MPKPLTNLRPRSRTGLRVMLGSLVLLVLLGAAGLAAYLTRDGRSPAEPATPRAGPDRTHVAGDQGRDCSGILVRS